MNGVGEVEADSYVFSTEEKGAAGTEKLQEWTIWDGEFLFCTILGMS